MSRKVLVCQVYPSTTPIHPPPSHDKTVHLLCEKTDEKKEHIRSDGNMNRKDDPQNFFWPKITDLSSTPEEGSSSYQGQANPSTLQKRFCCLLLFDPARKW
jgi:hypothetical protein